MNKILYIGNYRDTNSLGRVSRDYLLALIEAGADVVARPVMYGQPSLKTVDVQILKSEAKSSKGANICVQSLPYHHLGADSRFDKNIAILGFNQHPPKKTTFDVTHSIDHFDDVICLNNMTQMIVGALGGSIYSHPVSSNLTKEKMAIGDDKFVFYFIGKLSQRKNLDMLLTAFHREFVREDPVELLIKTTCDIDQQAALNIINGHINSIKQRIGKYDNLSKYKQEIVTTTNLMDENWGIIHNTGHCLVMPSYGEYTSLVPNIALTYGNRILLNDTFGLNDLRPQPVWFCESNRIYVEDSKAANLTNFESPKGASWYEVGIWDLQKNMRSIFESQYNEVKTPQPMDSFKVVGERLLQRIVK